MYCYEAVILVVLLEWFSLYINYVVCVCAMNVASGPTCILLLTWLFLTCPCNAHAFALLAKHLFRHNGREIYKEYTQNWSNIFELNNNSMLKLSVDYMYSLTIPNPLHIICLNLVIHLNNHYKLKRTEKCMLISIKMLFIHR